MAAKLKLIPGSTIRWGARRFVVVDYVGLDAVIAREVGQADSFRRREAAQGKSRFVGYSEHWCCNQRRLSIRFAKEGRRRGSPQSHRTASAIRKSYPTHVFHSQIAPFYSHLILGYPPRFANNFRIDTELDHRRLPASPPPMPGCDQVTASRGGLACKKLLKSDIRASGFGRLVGILGSSASSAAQCPLPMPS